MLTKGHWNPSRRDFLKTAAGAGAAMLIAPAWWECGCRRHRSTRCASSFQNSRHRHAQPCLSRGDGATSPAGPAAGRPASAPAGATTRARTLHRRRAQAVGAYGRLRQLRLDFANNQKPGDARVNFLHWLDAVDAQLEKGHIRRALNLQDLQAAHDHARPTIVQTVEGSHFIEGHLERVEEAYKRGLAQPSTASRARRHGDAAGRHEHWKISLGRLNTVWCASCEGMQPLGHRSGLGSRQQRDSAGRIESDHTTVHRVPHEPRQLDRQ